MSNMDKIKTAYSGWHKHANEGASVVPATGDQIDLVSEIERLKAELADAKAPKNRKAKLEVVE